MPEEEQKVESEAERKEKALKSLPQYRYTEPGEEPEKPAGTGRACESLRLQLRACVLQSDCCLKLGRTPKNCLNEAHHSVAPECYQLKHSFIACKRSTVDPRARFRGRKGDTR